ncbi:hypothetical protein C0Q70_11216 [Pomacea canaliculata]|uniref:Syntaxin-binding protein 5-like n=1 Tax=Pomacea canaliculata TaxID=400727 RepID=A0A2T7P5F2_POMCA|nr:hypothetical protein C0Q70_11216 [Pomacea canaliculata]
MKRFTLRGVLDGLRSSVSAPTKSDTEIEETLRSEHFHICKTVRHGFPYQPTSVAFDPVQHILAIGNKTGSLRIIGRPGVDIHCTHDGEVAIFQVLFLINEGALVTVCSDDTLHLWNYRQKKPEIVHSLKFQRERITYCHLPFQSKWLYIGTERGNVHIVNIESFVLSGYVINWNKAIELSRKTHPGPVVHLSDNPVDSNKLLIGFESGAIVMWDLRSKSADCRFSSPEALRSIAWHHEGKQFICSHSDGSLSTWNVKAPHKAASILMPHAKIGADGKPDPCKPIAKVAWKSVRNGEDMIIFSGGMSYDRSGRTPSITVMTGKSTTVLEMEHSVVDFVTLCETPWCSDFQDPYAIVVLLQNDLVVVDLTTPGYPCFENPYPMDLHESPVTACQYYANCPTDLIPAFYSVGSRQKKTGFSEKTWPINGGQWGTSTVSYPEIMITGHADGSLKFWDASSVSLQILYKLKTAKIFEKPKRAADMPDDDPFAIQIIYLCPESRILCVAGTTHIMLFRFSRQELTLEVTSLEFSIVYEIFDELDSPEFEYPCLPNPSLGVTAQHSSSMGSYSSNTSDSAKVEQHTLVKVRPGSRKWTAGYQADLVCILCFIEGEPPGSITVMSLNSSYGLMAFGNESGLAIVDFVQKTCLLNLGTPDLYGSMDPYQRAPRSPRTKKPSGEGVSQGSEEGKSPTTDQLPCVQSPVSKVPPPLIPPRTKRKRAKELLSVGESQSTDTSVQQILTSPASPDQEHDDNVFVPIKSPTHPPAEGDANNNPASIVAAIGLMVDTCAEHVPNPLTLSVQNAAHVVQKSSSTGSVSSDAMDGKTRADEAHSDNVVTLRAKPRHKKNPNMRRSSSDPDVNHQCKLSIALHDHKKLQNAKDNSSITRNRQTEEQRLERAGEASELSPRHSSAEDGRNSTSRSSSPRNKHPDNREFSGDYSKQADYSTPASTSDDELDAATHRKSRPAEQADTQHSKSFLHRFSVKIRSSLGAKSKTLEIEGDAEARVTRERSKMMKEKIIKVIDLSEENQSKPTVRRMSVAEMCQLRKGGINDGSSFSRSRSSSINSLDNVTREAIQCLVFADSYTRKTDNLTCPCLWVGTSLGSVIVINLNLPGLNGDQRLQQPVIVSPSGTIFRLKGSIVGMSFLDCNGILIPTMFDYWKEGGTGGGGTVSGIAVYGRDVRDLRDDKSLKTPRQLSVSTKPKISPTSSTEVADRQFVIICSEKQARVMSLPSQTCAYKVKITETSFVVRAEIVALKDSVCLMCYVANGHIMAFSLPSLKPLYDEDFLPLTDYRVARTFCFSNNGHALYLCSPTEVQKITYSAEIAENLSEMLGDLFLPCDTPEAPKQGFFKNLFGGGPSGLDREELFGEASGKASKGLAKIIPGAGGMQQLHQQAGAVGGDFARTRMLVTERGEKLGDLDDRSAQMMNQAENFAQVAHQIMLRYKDKKWYQF